ncbi:PAS domain-containing sensor histidine kinase [Massilia horti]|uniref:histidine kinase n=1 Tax=Massilia horti TaxID=2562153 RepID=A0A4Y9SSJ2_9BURK|nr:PAS domain-containing sensor histidine kinase [Massilia horti]TFW28309.1 PAS domain-containing sensor histidine kinase [Massilia horti]
MNRSVPASSAAPGMGADQVMGEHFRVIAEIGGDIAFSIDCATGQLRYISPAVEQLLGYGPAAFSDHLSGQHPQPALAVLCGGLGERLRRYALGDRTRLRVVRDFEVRHRIGQLVPVEVISTLVTDGDGAPLALVGSMRDLSARRAREAEQKRFASMLNHEFRTPLSTIDGAIQRLEATSHGADESARQRYRKIATAVEQLIGMLDDYLSPERMAMIGGQRRTNAIAPRRLLDEAADQARAAGRRVVLEARELPATLRCDPEGLRLALKVLLDNAIRYAPEDSPITLTGRIGAGGIELTVRDCGPGVEEKDAARIFDKFYRGSCAAGRPGSGLGLYMARSVIEVQGGTLELVQAARGGAEFRIWLPAAGGGKKVAAAVTNPDN